MSKEPELLAEVSRTAQALLRAREELAERMNDWIDGMLSDDIGRSDAAIMMALNAGHSVTEVAVAHAPEGKSPNRGAVYAVKSRHQTESSEDLPFVWVARIAQTAQGERTMYTLQAQLDKYGPSRITGEFNWRFDIPSELLEEDLSYGDKPYPMQEAFYKTVIARWLKANPYPGGG